MKVSVICLADRCDRLPLLFWSLIAQTHREWELLVLDQSPTADVERHIQIPEARLQVHRVPRHDDWGQTVKEAFARAVATGEALIFPNDDAYYVPTALADMLKRIEAGADLVLCGWLYDLFGYAPMAPTPAVGFVDVGGFLVRRSTFLAHGWPSKTQTGDGELVLSLVDAGARLGLCPHTLYVKS